MKYLLEKDKAKKIDEFAIKVLGIPSIVLMENAARSAAEIIKSISKPHYKTLVLCGVGNNGGDGLAIARHLYNFEYTNIEILMIGNLTKQTPDNKTNFEILKKMEIPIRIISEEIKIEELNYDYDLIIDAILGIGAKSELQGTISSLLNKINLKKGLKIAIDLPTGVDSDTGFSDQNTFRADYTVTMFSPKLGLFINEGKMKAGKVFNADLGVSKKFLKDFSNDYILEFEDLKQLIPSRKSESSKFDYGRILIIAGSDKYSGAAALTANACIKAGAGLVELFSNNFHSALLPEVIQIKGKSNQSGGIAFENLNSLNKVNDKYDLLALGPGLGRDQETIQLINDIIYNNLNKRIVIDADGLKGITLNKRLSSNVILTPHIFEFINIFKLNKDDVLKNPYFYAKEIAKEYNCIVLLKGTPTIITDGENSYFNNIGNSGMATAGSGDVLTGIISYYATQINNILLASAIGAFIHSYSGDIYKERFNVTSLTASELINMLKEIKIV